VIESFTMNITTVDGYEAFKASVCHPSSCSSATDGRDVTAATNDSVSNNRSRVDLILSCVDNYEARITINQV
jgi:ubiquitin-like modifier-activating enzyme 5